MRRYWFLMTFLISLVSLTPITLHAYCWSSGGGDGDAWLSGTITASGSGVADAQVYLQAETWMSGYNYAYESVCTDSNGDFSFKKETDLANNCYTTYSYYDYYTGAYTSNTYCNWSSAHCYQKCYLDDLGGWYSSYTFATEGYKIVASPSWGSTIADNYGNCEVSDITIDFNSAQTDKDCALAEKDIIIRIRIQDDGGNAATSGISTYVSGPTYGYRDIDASFEDFYVTAGTYYIGAYCTNYSSCDYACISNTNVTVADGDTIKEVTLTAKRSNATVAGTVSGSDGSAISGASISVGNYDYSGGSNACYAYGWSQTSSNGSYSVNMPSGNYTVYAYPPYDCSTGSCATRYASKEESVTLTASETTTKNITLQGKDSAISGTVKDSSGNPISGAWVYANAYNNDFNDWANAQTASDGTYSLGVVSSRKYNVQTSYWDSTGNATISNCSNEGMVTAETPATNVNFTFAKWDYSVTFAFVDASGNSLSSISGGGNIRPASSSEMYYCGAWINFSGGSITKKLAANTSYIIQPYTWGAGSYDPESAEISFTTGESGGSSSVNIPMITIDATISGNYVDADGNSVNPASNYMSISATRDKLWRSCTASSASYSCAVSAGKWCIGYWLDWNSGYASLSPGSSTTCIDVAAGSTNTKDLTFLKTGYVSVTVKDNQGNPLKWVWVDFDTQSADTQGETDAYYCYWGNGCSTNAEGKCTATVGASDAGVTYYARAYRPWSEMNNDGLTLPEEVSVIAVAGQTVNAPELVFRVLDGELSITITAATAATANLSKNIALPNPVINSKSTLAEDIVGSAYISCFSDTAGYSEATADSSGVATIKCASGDIWHCFAVNQLDNSLYISEAGDATCLPIAQGATVVSLKLNLVTDAFPDAVSNTFANTSANTITLSDKASFSTPANATGTDGTNASCTMQPDPILPYQAGKRPTCFYGYDISCTDANGSAITQFNADVTICMPLCDAQLTNLGLASTDLSLTYRDTSTDSYITLTSVTIDDTNNLVCGKTNHLTEFVIVGNGNLTGVDGDTEDATEEAERTGEEPTGEEGVTSSASGGCGCRMDGADENNAGYFAILIIAVGFVAAWRGYRKLLTVKMRIKK